MMTADPLATRAVEVINRDLNSEQLPFRHTNTELELRLLFPMSGVRVALSGDPGVPD